MNSVSDINNFNANLSEFQNTFSGKEGLEKIVKHLNDLHEAELQEIEEKRIAESQNIKNIARLCSL